MTDTPCTAEDRQAIVSAANKRAREIDHLIMELRLHAISARESIAWLLVTAANELEQLAIPDAQSPPSSPL